MPSTAISLPCITEKDAVDLAYALEQDVDWIGLSFVRNAQDIVELRERIEAEGKHTRIIAKIEKPEALEDLEGILEETDAVMIAAGTWGGDPQAGSAIGPKGHHPALHAHGQASDCGDPDDGVND